MATGTAIEVVMPQMGVSVSEGTVTKWMKNVGDTVASDETLLEISTDKVDTEVPSPGSGVIQEILVQEGETVAVGTVLARIGGKPAAALEPEERPELPAALIEKVAAADEVEAEPPPAPAVAPPPAPEPEPEPADDGSADGGHFFVSPVVARIAAEHGIDPSDVPGTGRDGRVTKKDILAFVELEAEIRPREAPPATPPAPPAAPPAASPPVPAEAPAPAAPAPVAGESPQPLEPGETIEPMSTMRRGIAEHMRRSLDTAAHVTSAIEVDMSRVAGIREQLKAEFQSSYGLNPTYLAFIARATVDTLRDWPLVNAEIRGESIVTRSYVNLGFAVALDRRQGPDRAGAEERRGAEPARDGARDRRPRRARPDEEAAARRRPGRHVHDHEPRQLRHVHGHADHQPAADRDPRHLRGRQAPLGDRRRPGPRRDRRSARS